MRDSGPMTFLFFFFHLCTLLRVPKNTFHLRNVMLMFLNTFELAMAVECPGLMFETAFSFIHHKKQHFGWEGLVAIFSWTICDAKRDEVKDPPAVHTASSHGGCRNENRFAFTSLAVTKRWNNERWVQRGVGLAHTRRIMAPDMFATRRRCGCGDRPPLEAAFRIIVPAPRVPNLRCTDTSISPSPAPHGYTGISPQPRMSAYRHIGAAPRCRRIGVSPHRCPPTPDIGVLARHAFLNLRSFAVFVGCFCEIAFWKKRPSAILLLSCWLLARIGTQGPAQSHLAGAAEAGMTSMLKLVEQAGLGTQA